jgi:heat shock protein HslJ
MNLRTMTLLMAVALSACASTPPRPEGIEWRLEGWSLSSQRADAFPITARFADGSVAGRSAVNTYRGPANFSAGNTLAIGPIATTRMAGPEPAMRAEHAYLQLLGDARQWRLDGDRLVLLDGKGNERLIYARAGE